MIGETTKSTAKTTGGAMVLAMRPRDHISHRVTLQRPTTTYVYLRSTWCSIRNLTRVIPRVSTHENCDSAHLLAALGVGGGAYLS